MKAIVVATPGKASFVSDRPRPTLRDDYLLVKTHAIALNPTDWKHAELTQTPGVLLGCDYAGVVEEVGPKVTKPFKKGDRVMGFVHGGNSAEPEDGAFAEYIVVKGDIQAHVPDDMSFEEAATFGVGITTVGQGLYQTLGLPLPGDETRGGQGPILIYGGSTATGVLGLQFARLSGFTPITTCSPHNFDLVTKFGAQESFDYGDDDAAEDIRASTDNNLTLCWDTVSTAWTAKFCASALSSKGGKLAALLPLRSPDARVECADTKAYTVFGEDWAMGDKSFAAKMEDFEFGKRWWTIAEGLIRQGKIRPHKIKVGAGGLKGALEGLNMLRDSKVSGHKLVYLVADTP
ncbi:zinc-binding dehydrogenase [Hirsutella rhossiliensis]|uniref:Zinc-binding dehydrogenase domain-containing protein n=1 Tax=Hirsutella rhossiliensis TaxID=111463 RepID=A0A9P8N2A4_9HYPO|nr:zinc-binding dehydrogenase domain-containing protein [Hirsutella rhossiliensis]KAH0965544.1 zinc-binding dehydrogenase domain-containing protein [Hirsutella rhossiliensis]